MQLGFYFDQTRCIGCHTCAVACKDWHDVPAGPVKLVRVTAIERGKYPKPFLAYLPVHCYHCEKPACIAVCPVNAISKREHDGVVVVDAEKCTGCKICLDACPYGVPQFSAEDGAKMQKCDLCVDKLVEAEPPICVAGCPCHALDVGFLDELGVKYGDIKEAAGFNYDADLSPSVIFKPKTR